MKNYIPLNLYCEQYIVPKNIRKNHDENLSEGLKEVQKLVSICRELSIARYDEKDKDLVQSLIEKHETEYPDLLDIYRSKLWILENDAESNEDMVLYVFGHAYELEAYDCWDELETFFKFASGRKDITYATNIEIKDYICGKKK